MVRGVFQPNKTRDITGQKFGSLTAVRFDHRDDMDKNKPHYWVFRCDCGNEIIARKNAVTSGNTSRCKECSAKHLSEINTIHGYVGTRLYREWAGMIQRCESPASTSWDRYGAKGVSVCEEWHDFQVFKEWAVGNGYTDSLTLDRINSNGNYCPANCRWASIREQANNKLKTLWIEFNGEKLPLSYWADKLGMSYHTLYDRLYRWRWPVEKAFTTPVRRAV